MAAEFDLLILGSGSTAFAAALRAIELGKTAAMTECRTIGGTCVNRGCLPSKNLIEAAKILYDANNPRYPGLSPASMQFDFRVLVEQKDEVIHDYRGKKYESIVRDSERVRVFTGQATLTDANAVSIDGQQLVGKRLLIATGSAPFKPDIPGLADIPFLTSDLLTTDESMELKDVPESLIIIGGGYIAMELGQMFSRFGTEVTILERGERILSHYEPEISESVTESLREEGVTIHTRAKVMRVQGDERQLLANVQIGGRQRDLKAAQVLIYEDTAPYRFRTRALNIGVCRDCR